MQVIETIIVGTVQTNCYLAYHKRQRGGFSRGSRRSGTVLLQTIERCGVRVQYYSDTQPF